MIHSNKVLQNHMWYYIFLYWWNKWNYFQCGIRHYIRAIHMSSIWSHHIDLLRFHFVLYILVHSWCSFSLFCHNYRHTQIYKNYSHHLMLLLVIHMFTLLDGLMEERSTSNEKGVIHRLKLSPSPLVLLERAWGSLYLFALMSPLFLFALKLLLALKKTFLPSLSFLG